MAFPGQQRLRYRKSRSRNVSDIAYYVNLLDRESKLSHPKFNYNRKSAIKKRRALMFMSASAFFMIGLYFVFF